MIQSNPQAIIDIGSNSVRLVVYSGHARAPAVLFNEKVMAGLGRDLGSGGDLDPTARASALRALDRFAALVRAMGVEQPRTVATAAVRDAKDGKDFVSEVEALGLPVDLLSGDAEGEAAGLGVISGIPTADGIVGDLGGGSLELVRVRKGRVRQRVSLPLGVLRVAELRANKPRAFENKVVKLVSRSGWQVETGLPFYLVGGSWRSLARLHMDLINWPLPVLHQYEMPADAASRLVRALSRMDRKRLRGVGGLSASRIPALGDAAALLTVLVRQFGSSTLVTSASGLREGLLFSALTEEERALDPLIAATRAAGALLGRFAEHGDLIDQWIEPLFEGNDAEDRRLRHAACLLGDVAWAASPEFRAERGHEIALHGNWTGINARGRAMMAQAVFASFGGSAVSADVAMLISMDEIARATSWGLAMRLGQRLSGGVAAPLRETRLCREGNSLVLTLAETARIYHGEAVERRHKQLAAALGLEPKVAG